ncbi:hypothetical protein ACFPRL_01600 [Pseudoclavibacter helvolus]
MRTSRVSYWVAMTGTRPRSSNEVRAITPSISAAGTGKLAAFI